MNKYKKFAAFFLGIEVLLIALANVIFFSRTAEDEPVIERTQENAETIYKVIYTQTDNGSIIFMDIVLGMMFLLSVFLLVYLGNKIIKPFHAVVELPEELAKGNLSVPVREEKSKFFGRFLWGMDMLRDTLESSKKAELDLQREKKTFVLSLSHDIKTPLAAIRLYTKALSEGLYSTEEKRKDALSGIEKNAKEIEGYISEIMASQREDFLNLTVTIKEFYLSKAVEGIRTYYADKFKHLHTEFVIAAYEDCLLAGDLDRLVEVMQNVLENAMKYGDGRNITMTFSEEEDCRLITVKNTGCLLKEEELPYLFDSFYRGSNAGTKSGSGLGLYICKQLMQKMDGEIFAETEDGRFAVTIVVRKCI